MNRLLRVLMWVLLLAALFVAFAYFLPSKVQVEKSKVIEASIKTVYNQVIDLHSWNNWSKWNQIDPDMKVEYSNNGVGENAGYKWSSDHKSVGNGTLKITKAQQYEMISTALDFAEQGEAMGAFQFSETDSGTLVTWSFDFDLGNNPVSRWMGLMIGKYVGADFDEGLTNLNAYCKLLEENKIYIVELGDLEQFNYASIRENVSFNEISLKMGEMYGEISQFLINPEDQMAGMPFAIYHLMNDEEIDLECGIPTKEKLEGNNKVNTGNFATTKCAIVDYYGDYHKLELGHQAVQSWMEKRGFALAGAPLEVYLTDPGAEPDMEKWLTRIYYPVE